MKKILVAAVLIAASLAAGAQTMYDGINFSQNNYYGTARTMALGNAVTALGGDLGTIGINPAGSAVASYGQFTITPGRTTSLVKSEYSAVGENEYSGSNIQSYRQKSMPNIGASFKISTGRTSGLKEITLAFTSNQTYNYNYRASSSGINPYTSKLAEFASAAEGISEAVLDSYDSFRNSGINWDILAAYQSGMFGSYGQGNTYVGNSELLSADGSYHYVPGELSQKSSVRKSGSKNDIVMNFGTNFDDRLYFGVNIGIPTTSYSYSEFYSEHPVNMQQFPISFAKGDTYFSNAEYDYKYAADATGLYAKFGVIYLPTEHLRIGAAFQTPTAFTVSEQWQYSCLSEFDNDYFDGSVSSPMGEYSYSLRSPYLFNVGVAYTIGKRGLLSVDYELADYSVMRFSEGVDDYDPSSSNQGFRMVNSANSLFCGVAQQLRIGAEARLFQTISLRAGFNMSTSPEKYWVDEHGNTVTVNDYLGWYEMYDTGRIDLGDDYYYKDITRSFSFGVGYESRGSFFADLAFRKTHYPVNVFSPYYDYDNCSSRGESVNYASPRIRNTWSQIDAALTLGWRF